MADLFKDGFESGDLTAWDSELTDEGKLSATEAAKLHGNYGLSCLIDDTALKYVTDETPVGETRYRARFYIDPNGLTMGSGEAFWVLKGSNSGYSGAFAVILGYSLITYWRIQVVTRNDALTYVPSSTYTITDEPHCIEIDWKASSAPAADDGYMSLWIDGVFKETVGSQDNDTRTVDFSFFGAVEGVPAGLDGTIYLDDFASNDDGSLIGQISENAVFFGCNF